MADETKTEVWQDSKGGVNTRKTGFEASKVGAAAKQDEERGKLSAIAAKGAQSGMPKQEPGEDPGAYGRRLREWRASSPQMESLKGMAEKK